MKDNMSSEEISEKLTQLIDPYNISTGLFGIKDHPYIVSSFISMVEYPSEVLGLYKSGFLTNRDELIALLNAEHFKHDTWLISEETELLDFVDNKSGAPQAIKEQIHLLVERGRKIHNEAKQELSEYANVEPDNTTRSQL